MNFGGGERPIVHTHFVDRARKVFAPVRIAANPQRIARRRQHPCHPPTGHLHAVHIQAQRRPVPRRRHMRPDIRHQPRAAKDLLVAANVHTCERPGAAVGIQCIDLIQLFQHDRAPAAAHRRRDPRFQRQPIHQIQRRGIVDGHPTVAAIERQSAAIAPRRPGRVRGRARIVLARGVGHGRAAVLVEAKRKNQSS